MNMKRMISLALMALLLCLPVWAMAKTYDLSQYTPIPDEDNDIFLFGVDYDGGSLANNDTITGTAAPCRIIQTGSVADGTTLYFNNVYVKEGYMVFSVTDSGSVTLVLQGNNYLTSKEGYSGLEVHGKLIIKQKGNLGVTSFMATNGCDIILPDYCGPVPAGQRFMQWSIQEEYGDSYRFYNKTAGESLTSGSQISIYPYFTEYIPDDGMAPGTAEPNPEIDNLPQTGDESNVILWSALACISLLGMMMLVRKRKNA